MERLFALVERSRPVAEEQGMAPAVLDHCVGCSKDLAVHVRTWEYMKSFWGKVITAPLCSGCAQRPPRPDFVVAEITRRQRRLKGAHGEGRTEEAARKGGKGR